MSHSAGSFVTRWLSKSNSFWFSLFTATTAFLLYTCIYGFRKAFAVGTFEGLVYLGVSYKVWLVIFQVVGYAVSKFVGIKVVSELKAGSRLMGILLLTAIAGASWFFFAITPAPLNLIFLFTNGLPLGMIWGLIFSYLEGRQTTDFLGAGLSVSFIFSAGFSKTVGAALMINWGIPEIWMPFAACCVFIFPLLIFLWLLDQVPPPTPIDHQKRTARKPMNGLERKRFIGMFGPGLVILILAYALLTAFRDFRDNFSVEIWTSLGFGNSPNIFTLSEIPISIVVLVTVGSMMFVENNRKALFINHLLVLAGFVIIGLTTYLFEQQQISPISWMTLVGLGLYLGYVPFNCIFFERLIAAFRYAGTVGFVMYLADAFGYLGSVGVLFFKEFGHPNLSWLEFFISSGYFISILGSLLIISSVVYFERKQRAISSSGQILAVGA